MDMIKFDNEKLGLGEGYCFSKPSIDISNTVLPTLLYISIQVKKTE